MKEKVQLILNKYLNVFPNEKEKLSILLEYLQKYSSEEIPINERVNMPKHYHFDFRYLFIINRLSDIILDKDEFKDYKWISFDELSKDKIMVI